MCDLMREHAAPWVSFYRLQHPVFHSITNLPTWRRYCGNACDDNSVTYLNLERAASSCAGSQSSLLKHSRPVSLSLSLTHTANTHTHHVTERERGSESKREREGEGGKRKGALLCLLLTWPLSSRHHPDHPHSPSSSLQKHNAHLRPLRSRAARLEVERQSRSRRLRWKGKRSAGALSLTHSPHTLAHTHTCYRQHATKETADSCSADRQAAGGGAPAFPPLHWVLVPHWRKIHMELGFLFWLSWQAHCRSHQVHLICIQKNCKSEKSLHPGFLWFFLLMLSLPKSPSMLNRAKSLPQSWIIDL